MKKLLTEAAGQLQPAPETLAQAIEEGEFERAMEAAFVAGEDQSKPSSYWRTLKQAADVVGNRELAHRFRAKRRETGLTDL